MRGAARFRTWEIYSTLNVRTRILYAPGNGDCELFLFRFDIFAETLAQFPKHTKK